MVFYVQKGKVRLTVVSKIGKEATIAIVGEGNFFWRGCPWQASFCVWVPRRL
jgi:CRP/FNR family cyclic AMP-dependent transcriptional regulator